jgi:hypothetical protein
MTHDEIDMKSVSNIGLLREREEKENMGGKYL